MGLRDQVADSAVFVGGGILNVEGTVTLLRNSLWRSEIATRCKGRTYDNDGRVERTEADWKVCGNT